MECPPHSVVIPPIPPSPTVSALFLLGVHIDPRPGIKLKFIVFTRLVEPLPHCYWLAPPLFLNDSSAACLSPFQMKSAFLLPLLLPSPSDGHETFMVKRTDRNLDPHPFSSGRVATTPYFYCKMGVLKGSFALVSFLDPFDHGGYPLLFWRPPKAHNTSAFPIGRYDSEPGPAWLGSASFHRWSSWNFKLDDADYPFPGEVRRCNPSPLSRSRTYETS